MNDLGPIDTRGIVTVALLASLGGAMSTFIGYLGNLINLSLGVPFGAGQFLAGLHVFWIVLIRIIEPKRGIGTFGGYLKGFVELFTGSTHGIVIVLVSLIQGIIIDLVAEFGDKLGKPPTESRIVWWIGAGVSSAANVIVFQVVYFAGVAWLYIAVITTLAFCSGVIFAGYFAWETLEFLKDTDVLTNNFDSVRPIIQPRTSRSIVGRNIPAILLILFISLGSLFYLTTGAKLLADPASCEIVGLVDNPYTYRESDFSSDVVTIEAELTGAYTHLPLANYTGVLVSTILEAAGLQSGATNLQVLARDGYSMSFEISLVMVDSQLLLTQNSGGLWLIAPNYDGSYWVQMVTTLQVG
ncbi:MAG: ECF transporter S component [Candidatus Thorarchaeota archaeon]|nr:ECF transporter S component [Candidatus Thorarchaeota archaeon]